MAKDASAPRSGGTARIPASWVVLRDSLITRWQALAPRERTGVAASAVVIGVFLLWSLAIQPAWRTAREAPAQLDRLGAQLQTMQRLAAEASELRNSAAVPIGQANAALQAATERLGSRAHMVLQGERATVTLKGMNGEDLRNWLAEVRSAARAGSVDVQLARDGQGYSGTVVLSLGAGR
ncbi:MAG: type II secretion system protein M [Burkholderiaceae bacterium]|nr:type II secretion system protein M [Burkholderiaceae bacterium]